MIFDLEINFRFSQRPPTSRLRKGISAARVGQAARYVSTSIRQQKRTGVNQAPNEEGGGGMPGIQLKGGGAGGVTRQARTKGLKGGLIWRLAVQMR